MLKNPQNCTYPKTFPEFDEQVPDVITINQHTVDQIIEKNKREKRVQWMERKKLGRLKNSWYPPEKRIEVATLVVAGVTNATHIEEITKIPAATVRDWKRQEWWGDLIDRIRYEKDEELDPKFTKIIEKTLDRITESLEEGDDHITKDGDVIKKKVSGKDAAQIMKLTVHERQLLRGKPTSRVEQLSKKDTLKELAEEFRKFAGAKTIEGTVENAEEEGFISGEGIRTEEFAEGEDSPEQRSEGHEEPNPEGH